MLKLSVSSISEKYTYIAAKLTAIVYGDYNVIRRDHSATNVYGQGDDAMVIRLANPYQTVLLLCHQTERKLQQPFH